MSEQEVIVMESIFNKSKTVKGLDIGSEEVVNLDESQKDFKSDFTALKKAIDSNKVNFKFSNLIVDVINLKSQSQLNQTEQQTEDPITLKAITFTLVSLKEDWKIPVELLFADETNMKQLLVDTVKKILKELHGMGINVISITFNISHAYIAFMLINELKTNTDSNNDIKNGFLHPVSGKMIFIFFDLDTILVHLTKHWISKGIFGYKHHIIDYSLCQKTGEIEIGNLLTYEAEVRYDWMIIKKRLAYNTEIVGIILADALEYLKSIKYPGFLTSAATIKFIKVCDLIAQIAKINGQSEELFCNFSQSNVDEWKPLIENILKYVKHLEKLNMKGDSTYDTLTTGLKVSFLSLLQLYSTYCEDDNEQSEKLSKLLPSRFTMKHCSFIYDITPHGLYQKFLFHKKNLQNIAV